MKKKIIPFLAAGVLIIVVILFMLLGNLIEKYTPTKDRQELTEYYGLSAENEAAIILNNEVLDSHAKMIDGHVYLDYNLIHDRLNHRFYWDSLENRLLYTTSSDLISVNVDSTSYNVTKDSKTMDHVIVKADNETAYVAVDFVKLYSDFSYEIFDMPDRIVISNEWGEYSAAAARKNTELRYQGGIKSLILADIEKGTQLTVLEPDETWTKVSTSNGIIGYVKSKTLGEITSLTLTSDYVPDEFTHIKKDFAINLGWHQVTNPSANSTISSVLTNTKGLNVISPTWFYLNDNNGNIASLASSDYVNYRSEERRVGKECRL